MRSERADQRTVADMEKEGVANLKIRDRIKNAVRIRLERHAGNREAARRALALLSLPFNAPLAMRLLYRTVDAMWYAAGDTSTDFNFYTKRATLAGVYSSTLLYWLNDRSPGERGDLGLPRPAHRRRHADREAEDRRSSLDRPGAGIRGQDRFKKVT